MLMYLSNYDKKMTSSCKILFLSINIIFNCIVCECSIQLVNVLKFNVLKMLLILLDCSSCNGSATIYAHTLHKTL